MSDAVSGSVISLEVERNGTWQLLGLQTGFTENNNVDLEEVTNKEEIGTRWAPGKQSGTIEISYLYILTDQNRHGQKEVEDVRRNGERIRLRKTQNGSPISTVYGYVADETKTFTDGETATVDVTIQKDGLWQDV